MVGRKFEKHEPLETVVIEEYVFEREILKSIDRSWFRRKAITHAKKIYKNPYDPSDTEYWKS